MSEIVGLKTLIVGDVGAGKTRLTRRLLGEELEMNLERVTVIDMAPDVVNIEGVSVGGALLGAYKGDIRLLRSNDIKTPRLSAKSPEELLQLADHNRREIEGLLDAFDTEPSETLFVNDVSIYLQSGKLERLWDTIKLAETVVVNGYFGTRLEEDLGTGVSARERRLMEELASRMDKVVDSSSLRNQG
jgi:GTPase SAR1 family protein